GRLGRLVSFEARYERFRAYLSPNAWGEADLQGSRINYDLGAPLIDQSLQIFELTEGISSNIRKQREGARAIDDFELNLHYPQLKVSLKGSMLVKEPTPRYALYGTEGAFVKYGVDPQEAALKAGGSPQANPDWGTENREIWGKLNIWQGESDTIEYIESERGDYP